MSEIRMLLDEIRDLKRRLQALETRQEHPGFAASDVARLSVANTFAGVQTIPNTGLHLLDTNATHDLIIAPGSNLTADRTLTVTTGDADRTLTMTGSATVNQDVSTAGSPTFAGLTVDTNTLFVDAANNRVGIGTTSPLGILHLEAAGGGIVYCVRNDSAVANFGWRFRGSDNLTDAFISYNNDVSQALAFGTGAGGAGVAMVIADSKSVGINSTNPSGKLDTRQSSTTAAIPTVYLQQADLSEEFFRFDTTVGAGNPINTTALGAYYGRVRVYVVGVGAKWLALYDA